MPCKNCIEKPVYFDLANNPLCKTHFIRYVEQKALKTIRTYRLIDKDDIIAVGLSGGKDSMTCLYILKDVLKHNFKDICAIAVDEGIESYRDTTIEDAKKFCKQLKVPLKIVSYKKEFKKTLDEFVGKGLNACAFCGILRRYLLNKTARELKATKLATGHNLDDESQSLLMNELKGNLSFSAKLGPRTGVLVHSKFIPRIKPLYFLTEKEITIYSKLKQFPVRYNECPNAQFSFRTDIQIMLNSLEEKYPGTKHSIVNSFLSILPELRKKFQDREIGTCNICNEPAAKSICRTCNMLEKAYKKWNTTTR